MTTTTFDLSEDILPGVESIVTQFGFKNKEEFFQEAIRDKVLELQKKIFLEGTNQISKNLKKKGITEKEMLEEFFSLASISRQV